MASVFAFRPVTARAEWVEGGRSAYAYCVNTTNIASSGIKVSPIQTNIGKYAATTIISPGYYYESTTGGTTYKYGQAWNTVPDNITLVRFASFGGGNLPTGRRIEINCPGTVKVNYTASAIPAGIGSYMYKTITCTDFRYYVSGSGNTGKTRIYPDSSGSFTMPIDAQYVFVTCQISLGVSGVQLWNISDDSSMFGVSFERPEDQNEVAAINDQTETLTNTDGSDTVTTDVTGQYTQDVENLDLFQLVNETFQTIQNGVSSQEQNGVVAFPGMSFQGFTLPAANVDPTSFMPSIMPHVKLVLTFVFCAAFVSHIVELLHALFGIWEYGANVESFGEGSGAPGYSVRKWTPDYSIDEDLGF